MILNNTKSYLYLLLFSPSLIFAQVTDFNNFKTTQAIGKPPSVFTTSFNEKVTTKIVSKSEIDKKDIRDYARYTNYSTNNLLQSGDVLYGDPMTQFVNKVAANLLKNETQLKEQLQFYVLKNNTTNALCTDPGVIFITTGLISQIENEAQLAYVIAHEIVHYQERHLEKSFNKHKETDLDPTSSYEDLVLQSKDHEFEADANALKLYHAAGYSEQEINTVFDVLMYSYLTFDEIDIDESFLNNTNIYIPRSYFPEQANPILAFEDYDDTKSSHPNIRKRKDAIAKEIGKYNNWKTNNHFFDLQEFKHIQDIARFESVRGNLLSANYIKALYEIYILEKEFKNSEYLQTSKALAWCFMSQTNLSGKRKSFISNIDEKEGAISILYGFFNELSQEEMALLAVRKTQDIHLEFPSSKRIKEIRDESISILAHLRKFDISKLEKINYFDAIESRNAFLADTVKTDTTTLADETKYDRIRRIRAQQSSSESIAELKDENFASFLLYDLVSDREFNEIYEKAKAKRESEKGSNLFYKKDKKKQRNEKKEKFKGDIIVVTPYLEAIRKGNFDLDKTLLFYDLMSEEIIRYAPFYRLHNSGIVLQEDFTTEKYNRTSLINSYLIQKQNLNNGNFKDQFIDYDEMQEFIETYKNPYLVVIVGEAKKMSIFRNYLSGTAQYIEISSGNITRSPHYTVDLKVRRASVGGLAFQIFSKF